MKEAEKLGLRVIFLTWLRYQLAAWEAGARSEVLEDMKPGDRMTVWSPLGDSEALGSISKSAPESVLMMTDETLLLDWLEENYPEHIRRTWEQTGPAEEIEMVLKMHAPHLLTERRSVQPWALAQMKHAALEAGRPVGQGGELDIPGVEMSEPVSHMTVRGVKSESTDRQIRALIAASLISPEGRVGEIESSD